LWDRVYALAIPVEVHEDFVADAHDDELLDVARLQLVHRLVGEATERFEHQTFVLHGGVHQQVEVVREPGVAGLDDGKASDHDLAGAEAIQLRAQPTQVFEARRSRDFLSAAWSR
jgi:hypothetical protein